MSAVSIMLSLMSIRLCFLPKNSGTKRSVRGVFVFWCSHYSQDCLLNCEIWIAFFALSCFTSSMPVVGADMSKMQDILELQKWLEEMRPQLDGYDATLYSPTKDNFPEACKHMTMQCFLLELEVAMFEKNISDIDGNIKSRKNETLLLTSSCPPCEIHEVASTTVFLERFQQLLQMMLSDYT